MAIKDRLELANLIKGQEVHVPPLEGLFFRHWPYAVNEAYEQLRPFVDAMLVEIEHDNTVRLNELREADFALFAASFWPYADFEDLKVVARLSVWLFLWDDEIDEVNGKLTNDLNAADTYRQDTLIFVQSVLGLGTHDVRHVMNTYITAFAPIGEVLKRRCTQDQLEMFVSEVAIFLDGSRKEQECRLASQIPSLKSFWEARLGTSAVGVCDTTIEFAHHMSMPKAILLAPDLQLMRNDANAVICVINDILSIKKELGRGYIDSLIPIRCAECVPVQTSVDAAVADLVAHGSRFEDAAVRLQEAYATDPHIEELKKYITALQQSCTAVLYWTYASRRYGLASATRPSCNEVIFTL